MKRLWGRRRISSPRASGTSTPASLALQRVGLRPTLSARGLSGCSQQEWSGSTAQSRRPNRGQRLRAASRSVPAGSGLRGLPPDASGLGPPAFGLKRSRSGPLEQVRYGHHRDEHRRYRDDGAYELHHGLPGHVLLSGGAFGAASFSGGPPPGPPVLRLRPLRSSARGLFRSPRSIRRPPTRRRRR